jgi:two-component system, chemotaxis family, sensor kinase CheA
MGPKKMGDADIVKEFLVESYENLRTGWIAISSSLRKTPRRRKFWRASFAPIHTIQGTCGFLGFNQLETAAHAAKNLLSRLRDGVLQLSEEITTVLLKLVDSVREMLSSIESQGNGGERDDGELISTLTRLLESGQANEAKDPNERHKEIRIETGIRVRRTRITPPARPVLWRLPLLLRATTRFLRTLILLRKSGQPPLAAPMRWPT